MCGALWRLRLRLRRTRTIGRCVPPWVWSLDFRTPSRSARVAQRRAAALLGTLADATRALSGASASPSLPSTSTPSLPPPTATQTAATVRVCFGEMLEALAASVARTIVGDEQAPSADADKRALSLLYYDSYCAAVWTSAHAEYLGCIQDLLGERAATEAACARAHGAPTRPVHRDQHEPPAAPWGAHASAQPRRAAAPSRRRRSLPS